MKISSFDAKSLDVLRAAIEEALVPVAAKYGIVLRAGRITYSQNVCTVKVEASVIAETGEAITREAEAFKRFAHLYGLTPEHLNRTFVDRRGTTFKLIGLNTKARTKPFIIQDADGRKFVAPESMVFSGFGIKRDTLPPAEAGLQETDQREQS